MNEIVPSNTSLTPEQAFPFQKQIDSWNMESAVEKLRPKVERLRKASVDVARDLFIAHEALAQRGGDRRSEDAQTFGFCDFLGLVGLSKKTAYLWLKLYDPVEDKVRTPEELQTLKSANPELGAVSPAVQELQSKKERLIAHAMATGERLYDEGWNELGCEKEYRIRLLNKRLAPALGLCLTVQFRSFLISSFAGWSRHPGASSHCLLACGFEQVFVNLFRIRFAKEVVGDFSASVNLKESVIR